MLKRSKSFHILHIFHIFHISHVARVAMEPLLAYAAVQFAHAVRAEWPRCRFDEGHLRACLQHLIVARAPVESRGQLNSRVQNVLMEVRAAGWQQKHEGLYTLYHVDAALQLMGNPAMQPRTLTYIDQRAYETIMQRRRQSARTPRTRTRSTRTPAASSSSALAPRRSCNPPPPQLPQPPQPAQLAEAVDTQPMPPLSPRQQDENGGMDGMDRLTALVQAWKIRYAKLRQAKKESVKYWKKKARAWRTKFEDALKKASSYAPGKRRSKHARLHRLSWRGGIRIAFKRNFGHVGAMALAATMDTNISRQTVTRWEHILSACLMASSQSWYASHYSFIEETNKACAQ